MTTASASAKLLDPVLQVARHLQQDPDALLQQIGISRAAIQPAGARIPAARFSALLEALARQCANPRIALRAGEATQPRMLGSVGFVMTTAATLGSAYQLLNDYLPLLIEGVHLSLHRDERGATLLLDLEDDSDRPLAEWLLAGLHSWPRWLIGKQIPLRSVDLAFAEPEQPQPYEQFFAAEVTFDAPRYRLHFSAELLDQPCLDANPEIHRHHLQFADQLLSASGRDGALVAQVKSLIRNQIATDPNTVNRERVARRLNLSLRTLQRKLDQQGTHFQALYDQIRRDLALQLIHRGDCSFGEISYQLGFSALSAFQKAFRRWTGQAPGQYRASLQAPLVIPDTELPRTLDELAQEAPCEPNRFFALADSLIRLLIERRQRGAPPPALLPSLIEVSRDERGNDEVRLRGAAPTGELNLLEQLSFGAPERNGLLPETSAASAQVYELGALFYLLLHGRPPHGKGDAHQILQAQLQQTPPLADPLPSALQALLRRALNLDSDCRYGSLDGLLEALRRARFDHQRGSPSETDSPLTSAIPEPPSPLLANTGLVGRRAQQEQLDRLFRRTCHNDGRLLLLEGVAGSGKSALITALATPLFRAQGMLLRIAFQPGDAERRHDPLLEPLRRLVRQKLSLAPRRRALWAQQLRRELATSLPALVAALPELRLLPELSAAPDTDHPPPTGSLTEALARLLSLQREPLLLHFDDLHHASPQAIALLTELMPRLGRQPLLLVAAYDSTALADSALAAELPRLAAHRQSLAIPLPPLTHNEVLQLTQRLLGEAHASAGPLADWLAPRCGGNPGRLVAELEQLVAEQQLQFDHPTRCWRWRAPPASVPLNRTAIDRITAVVAPLPGATRELLDWAALLAPPFDHRQLAHIRRDPAARIEIHLWPAIEAGLLSVEPKSERYRFDHPGLRQWLQEQLEDSRKAELHWRIATALLESASNPIACCRHLDAAYRLRPDRDYRLPLARLHQQLGEETLQQADPSGALGHFEAALGLLEPRDTKEEAAFCDALFDQGLALLLRNDAPEQLAAWLERIKTLDGADRPAPRPLAAIAHSRLCAGRDPDAAPAPLLAALRQRGVAMATSATERLDQLQRLDNTPASARDNAVDPLLDELVRQAEQQLQPEWRLGAWLNRPHSPLEQQLLRWELLGEPPTQQPAIERPQELGLNGARRLPWCAPLAESIAALTDALSAARLAGDEPSARRLLLPLYNSRWFGAEPLSTIAADLALELSRYPEPHPPELFALQASVQPLLQTALNGTPTTAPGAASAPQARALASPWALLGRVAAALLSQQRQHWPQLIEQAQTTAHRFSGLLAEAQLLLLSALMAAQLAPLATGATQLRWRQLVRQQQARFEFWARHNAALFAAPAALLGAENALLEGDERRTIDGYDSALSQARDAEQWLLAMLCGERFGAYWQRGGQTLLAEQLLGCAQTDRARWCGNPAVPGIGEPDTGIAPTER